MAKALRIAVDLGLERTFFDDDQFVVGLRLRRMRCRAGIDGRGMAIELGERRGRAIEEQPVLAGFCRLGLELRPVVDCGF